MIRSFRCQETEKLFHRQQNRKFGNIGTVARRKLRMLDDAESLIARPGSSNGHPETCTAQAKRHGPAQPPASASDNCNFSIVHHGYRLMARIPCSW